MRNTLFFALVCAALGLISCQNSPSHTDHSSHGSSSSDNETPNAGKGSPHRMAMLNIGSSHVHIEYNAPSVRNRMIWGGLVALDEVWVTGAHDATSISFSKEVKIAGKSIPKGKYAFFTIPSRQDWTLILNKNWDQHLADEYDAKDDVLRWTVKPDTTEFTEQLTYKVVSQGDSGRVELYWEKLRVTFSIYTQP